LVFCANVLSAVSQLTAAIIKPIVKEAVREAMNVNSGGAVQGAVADRSFLTVKQAAEASGLAVQQFAC
jgi:hypothetical protein